MRKIINLVFLFFLALNVILPIVFYTLFGYVQIYPFLCDYKYILQSTVIILLYSLFLLFIFNIGKKKKTNFFIFVRKYDIAYLIIILLYEIYCLKVYKFGEEKKSYLQFFFNAKLIYFVVSFYYLYQKKYKTYLLCAVIFLSITIMNLSRSGILWIVIYFVFYFHFDKKNRKQIIKFFFIPALFFLFISPIIFAYTTTARSGRGSLKLSTGSINKIIGRFSILETSGGLLEAIDYGHKYERSLFMEKYSLNNQLKIIINGFVPGEIFEYDVYPNLYYRAIVGYMTEEEAKQNYTSINIALPVYLFIKYGILLGFFMFCLLFYLFVYILSKFRMSTITYYIVIELFFDFLVFFDWCYFFKQLIFIFFSWIGLLILNKLKNGCLSCLQLRT